MSAENRPDVYNLFWFSKKCGTEEMPAWIRRGKANKFSPDDEIEAIILYPALATPEILVGDLASMPHNSIFMLEVLLLTKGPRPDIKRRILEQLKFTKGFDPKKTAFAGLLPTDHLDVNTLVFDLDVRLYTKSLKFSGFLDKRPFEIYKNHGYTTLYSVSIDPACLVAELDEGAAGEAAPEPQDFLMAKEVFGKHHPELRYKKDQRFHGFSHGGSDLDYSEFDPGNPIQAWHPVYHFKQLKYANVGHYSDLHLSSRQRVLAKSQAQVIDYAGSDAGKSPELGQVINICSKDVTSVLGQFASSKMDLLFVGGDVVDFLQNIYPSEDISKKVKDRKPKHIWDAVGLTDSYPHTDYVDLIVFYSMLTPFCQNMPVFMLTGNHDCYWEPYGISPRLFYRDPGDKWYQGSGTGLIRANQGIPADHNLTFYEAILTFGPTYHEVKTPTKAPWKPHSPFADEHFDWFYMVFTPFSDYLTELPLQCLAALGWGNDEVMLDVPPCGHGVGHLPRANEAISKLQLQLLDDAVGKKKKTILSTHFTFVSYKESIPMNQGDSAPGDVYFSVFHNINDYNFGTFEGNRSTLFDDHCHKNRDIQIVLTGHSHRRGLYLIDDINFLHNKVTTRHFDFDDFWKVKKWHSDKIEPAIIVSDSGATIPRFNKQGEFSGWGSDVPSGTAITFDQSNGAISDIHAVRAHTCKPRAVVALDYLDIYIGDDVITRFETSDFEIEDERLGTLPKMYFHIDVSDAVAKLGILFTGISFYVLATPGCSNWKKIDLELWDSVADPGKHIFTMKGEDIPTFRDAISSNQRRGNFIAISLGCHPGKYRKALSRYNFDHAWCYEFQVKSDTHHTSWLPWSHKMKKYIIKRDKDRAEIPSFDWRKDFVPEKYA